MICVESFEVTYPPIFKCFKVIGEVIFAYTYDLCTTLVVKEAGGCLTKINAAQCKAVLPEREAVFVDFFHF
jgi:hypothetical protein